MTKAKSKPCITCAYWDGGCSKGFKPRFYKEGGLRRVCSDFTPRERETVHLPEYHNWVDSFMKIFGFKRA